MKIIEAKNINYQISNKLLFKNLNLDIESSDSVAIIGENCSGKSTLLKLLGGQIVTNNNIKIDGVQINKYNTDEIMNKSSYINYFNEFFSKTVINEILQDKKNVNVFDANGVRKLLDNFNLLSIENISPQELSYAENQIVALIKAIVNKSKIIFLDNAFSRLDDDKREELFCYLLDYAKKNNITVICTTNNVKDLKLFNRIILLKDYEISFDGNYNELLKNVDLPKEGLKMPWEIEVSNKLMMYDLIDTEYDSIDALVGELCK